MNIYIGNFSYETNEDDLHAVFGAFGHVENIKIIKDKFTGQSKGFAFVDMPDQTQAQAAMSGITEVKGRRITINEARPQVRHGFGPGKRSDSRERDYNRRSY